MVHISARFAPVHVVGLAATPLLPEQDAVLDELVYDALSAALGECALSHSNVGLSVLASMDAIDGRSISSGLTTAAAAGYLRDSYRIEGDCGQAIIAAAEAVSAGDVEVSVAVAVYNPEITGNSADRANALTQLSNLGFEPIFDRPVGMTAAACWAMQASALIQHRTITELGMARLSAEHISRGSTRPRAARRAEATADDVLQSPMVAWPLRELMLPAESTGAVAVVLASPQRAARCYGRNAVITGTGHATGDYTWSGEWLVQPTETTRRAATLAYRNAGFESGVPPVDLVEFSAPTPALHQLTLDALGLGSLPPDRINPSGGMASNHPGILSSGVRLLDALESVEAAGWPSARAVVHSIDTLTGPIADDATVLIVEVA